MRKRIGIFTDDSVLYNKMRLLLRHVADVELLQSDDEALRCELIFEDIDTAQARGISSIKMSRSDECDIPLPFRHEDLLSLIESTETSSEYISMSDDRRHVYLGDERIKLTEIEYKLLAVLMAAKDDFVTREALLSSVWGEGFDAGVVNVYVHYLRNKLEKDGRKIILSSRKEGYGIDRKYRRDK